MATLGLIPFVSFFACFVAKRAFDHIRMVIAQPRLNVKVVTAKDHSTRSILPGNLAYKSGKGKYANLQADDQFSERDHFFEHVKN